MNIAVIITLISLSSVPGLFALPMSVKDGLLASGFLSSFYSDLSPSLVNMLSSPDFAGMVFAFVDPPNGTTPAPLTYPIEAYIVPGKAWALQALKPPMTLSTMGNLTVFVDKTLGGIVHLHPGPIAAYPNDFSTVLMTQAVDGGKSIIYVIDKPY